MTLLAKGQYSDALSHFHAAIDADPTNYMSYYKRATVFLALSRSRPALADLDKVLQLKSDFVQVSSWTERVPLIFLTLQIWTPFLPDILQAKAQRANVLLKMGRLDEAHIDAENVLRKDPEHEDANRVYAGVEVMKVKLFQVCLKLLLKSLILSNSFRRGFKMQIATLSIKTTKRSSTCCLKLSMLYLGIRPSGTWGLKHISGWVTPCTPSPT